jgi:hypothetical protein
MAVKAMLRATRQQEEKSNEIYEPRIQELIVQVEK